MRDLTAPPPTGAEKFEFRSLHPETYALLEPANAACSVFDLAGETSQRRPTADFAYFRLHKQARLKHAGRYSPGQLRTWLMSAEECLAQGARRVYVCFENDPPGYAALNALELEAIAGSAGHTMCLPQVGCILSRRRRQ